MGEARSRTQSEKHDVTLKVQQLVQVPAYVHYVYSYHTDTDSPHGYNHFGNP